MTVANLKREMSAKEFREWYEFWLVEPWGDQRADLRAGMCTAPLFNALTGKRIKASDFMYKPPTVQTSDQSEMAFRHFVAAHNAKVRANGNSRRTDGVDSGKGRRLQSGVRPSKKESGDVSGRRAKRRR